MNSVFYAETYHPIQAGSIDGTDVLPHDNAVYRALLSSSAGLYDPFGDRKVTGDPYCSLFVGRLSHLTTEDTLRKAMEKYGRVKDLRLVRHIVTGASRGYAFVEFETERDMRRAFEEAHHSFIDDSEIIVDYNRQQLMPGWIPRRLGGGLGGKKESGQLRFGGRERPFRAPLRPIPHEELKRLGIPPPPEGKYKSRFQVPSPPRKDRTLTEKRDASPDRNDVQHFSKKHSTEREKSRSRSIDRKRHSNEMYRRETKDYSQEEDDHKVTIQYSKKRRSDDKGHLTRSSIDVEDESGRDYAEEHSPIRRNKDRDRDTSRKRTKDKDERHDRSSRDRDEHSSRRSKGDQSRSSERSRDGETRNRNRSNDHKESSRHHRHSSTTTHSHHKRHHANSKSP